MIPIFAPKRGRILLLPLFSLLNNYQPNFLPIARIRLLIVLLLFLFRQTSLYFSIVSFKWLNANSSASFSLGIFLYSSVYWRNSRTWQVRFFPKWELVLYWACKQEEQTKANKSIPDTCKKKKNGRSVFVWSHKKGLTNSLWDHNCDQLTIVFPIRKRQLAIRKIEEEKMVWRF